MNELNFQKALIDAAKKEGGYGFKMSNRHLAGIPDLLIKLPEFDTALIECKKIKRVKFSHHESIPNNITKLQEIVLKRFINAGGAAGVAT